MTIQFQCKGCRHECTEPESGHAEKGYCGLCNAKGIGLPQIRSVEKWEARDGTLHDSLEAAEEHQLKAELEKALKVGEGYAQRQAMHLLSHFDIKRKGDAPKGVMFLPVPPAPDYKSSVYFWAGFVISAVLLIGANMLFR